MSHLFYVKMFSWSLFNYESGHADDKKTVFSIFSIYLSAVLCEKNCFPGFHSTG